MTEAEQHAATIREHLPADYLGPDRNDPDGEKWGVHPEALAALDALVALADTEAAEERARQLEHERDRYRELFEHAVADLREEPDYRCPYCGRTEGHTKMCEAEARREADQLREERGERTGALGAAHDREHKLRTLLAQIRSNAEGWHGPEGLGTGQARALRVIAEWCEAALAGEFLGEQRHGRACGCTACQAEDWDAIDAGLKADQLRRSTRKAS